ncbi:hypothetical protein TPHA_0I01020 [Tetrapisispora phaffii CBS 4417]|uniref:RBR-type E3 ubiquitin transferase n=1 Tax=Tetrapisispora phaffii (strain ATCC 24235 / CBS 4417 / NBRC 1672 / NRRL Y-8282 / UCD 70-5) TaxID=1071381 RepID=G8BXI0_TETPH|nr:hypothetical protein TPHA_0I01020 [Tetrapisispora phaffii CBS 4417]CCE64608.1 hypothetical protein TPHA_0I01020 [Tetrapisispora phaffii CBS 4417]
MANDEDYQYSSSDDDFPEQQYYEPLEHRDITNNILDDYEYLNYDTDSLESFNSDVDIVDGMAVSHVTNPNKKRSIEGAMVNLKYECFTTQDIFNNMLEKVDRLQPMFSIPREDIILLLQKYGWDEDRLLEDWTNKMDGLLIEAGIHINNEQKELPKSQRGISNRDFFTCPICCEDQIKETYSLECGHEYCISCYRHYIEDRLNKGNIITCMSCSLALKNTDIDELMNGPSSEKLMHSSIKSFVQKHNENYRWCPFTDCKCIVHIQDTTEFVEYIRLHYSPYVLCNESHRFCFSCSFEMHSPADCEITSSWIKKAKKESDNLNWVLSHTKECPKCSVNIEKNGGCNHMICSSCKYEFCWICNSDWKPHGSSFYQCTMYNNDELKTQTVIEDVSKTLKRYTFFYRMFNEHEVSAKLDWQLGQTVGNKIKSLQEKMGVSWIEGQFLTESLKILNEGRTALKWSFAVVFYSDSSHNLTKIFVDNQALLANSVEDLSALLQIKSPETIMEKKVEFYNKAGYVENRTYALMECGRELISKGIVKITN